MTPVVYVTGHEFSNVVGKAFAEGCRGEIRHVSQYAFREDEVPCFYGILRGTEAVVRSQEAHSKPYVYLDHGYFKPGHFGGYYRCCVSGLQARYVPGRFCGRWNDLGLAVAEWRVGEGPVVVVRPSGYVAAFYKFDPVAWIEQVTEHEESCIVTGKTDAAALLAKAAKLVTVQSNVSIAALLKGVPVEFKSPVGMDIYHPARETRDREDLFASLANSQFTLAEFVDGTAWKALERDL